MVSPAPAPRARPSRSDNVGAHWAHPDYVVMVEYLRAGRDVEEIAHALQRRPKGVRTRLKWLMPAHRGWKISAATASTELPTLLRDPGYAWRDELSAREKQRLGLGPRLAMKGDGH